MNVLIDVSAGQIVGNAIRRLGHDVLHVRDVDPRMADIDILAWAVRESRLVVSMDKDFGELVYRSGLPHAGVLLLPWKPRERLRKCKSSLRFLRITPMN